MADKSKKSESSPTLKRSFFQQLKLEFGKISWPNKSQLTRESVAVIISAIVLGLIIAGVDTVLQYGLSFII